MRSKYFTMTPGTTFNTSAIGFLARSALIDNPTPQWWLLPDGRRIKPFTVSNVVNFTAVAAMQIKAEAPPGIFVYPNVDAAARATVVMFEESYDNIQGIDMGSSYPSDASQATFRTISFTGTLVANTVTTTFFGLLASSLSGRTFWVTRVSIVTAITPAYATTKDVWLKFQANPPSSNPASITGLACAGRVGAAIDFGPNPIPLTIQTVMATFDFGCNVATDATVSMTGYYK